MLLTYFERPLFPLFVFVGIGISCALGSEICVSVRDELDLPLPHARIDFKRLDIVSGNESPLSELNVITDENGNLCNTVQAGSYSIEIRAKGYMNVRYQPVRARYAKRRKIMSHLPIDDTTEGPFTDEAILDGKLIIRNGSAGGAEICIGSDANVRLHCTTANELGEYHIALTPGSYTVQVRLKSGREYRVQIRADAARKYENLIDLGDGS